MTYGEEVSARRGEPSKICLRWLPDYEIWGPATGDPHGQETSDPADSVQEEVRRHEAAADGMTARPRCSRTVRPTREESSGSPNTTRQGTDSSFNVIVASPM